LKKLISSLSSDTVSDASLSGTIVEISILSDESSDEMTIDTFVGDDTPVGRHSSDEPIILYPFAVDDAVDNPVGSSDEPIILHPFAVDDAVDDPVCFLKHQLFF